MKQYTKDADDSANKNTQSVSELSVLERHILIRASTLKTSHKHYLIELNIYLGSNEDAWPAQATLARAMSAGLSSIKQWQSELTKMGILLVDSGKGCRSSNRYRLDLSCLPMPDDSDSEWSATQTINGLPDRPVRLNGLPDRPEWSATQTINGLPHRPLMVCQLATKGHIKDHVKGHTKDHSPGSVSLFSDLDSNTLEAEPQEQPDDKESWFENWYKVYPRRIGKGAAEKAYRSTIKKLGKRYDGGEKEAAEFLLERATRFAASSAGQNGQYTAYPGTWLNQLRYDDDEAEWSKGNSVSGKSHSDFGKYDPDAEDLPW